MESSTASKTNLQNASYLPNQPIGEVIPSANTAPTTVDMKVTSTANVETIQAEQTQVESTNTERFDTDTKNISPVYVQKYMSGINKSEDTGYRENENGDKFGFNNIMSNSNSTYLLKLSFKNQFLTQKEDRDNYDAAIKLFATLNNNDYKYGQMFYKGAWYNVRTPIDANGNTIGFPEQIDDMGNPIIDMEPKNIHSIYN